MNYMEWPRLVYYYRESSILNLKINIKVDRYVCFEIMFCFVVVAYNYKFSLVGTETPVVELKSPIYVKIIL